jgi:hypothetical protein
MNTAANVQIERADYDAALKVLAASKGQWVRTSVPERIALLASIKECLMPVAQPWADAAARAKGLTPDSPLAGEEWMSGPYALMAYCNSMIQTLQRVAGAGHLGGVPLRTLANGRWWPRYFPTRSGTGCCLAVSAQRCGCSRA